VFDSPLYDAEIVGPTLLHTLQIHSAVEGIGAFCALMVACSLFNDNYHAYATLVFNPEKGLDFFLPTDSSYYLAFVAVVGCLIRPLYKHAEVFYLRSH